ncbi:MAG: LysR family transcriptional regulator [Rhizobiaceae bacterium]
MDKLVCIRTFGKVVDAGTFAAAARQLRVSPATVTKHIQHLEGRLGVRLFNRNTQKVTLTEAGDRYARHCGTMLSGLDHMEAELGELARRPQGRLRVSAAYDFGVRELKPAVLAFVQKFPEIEVELHLSQRLVDLTGEEFDLAVRCVSRPGEADLVIRRLATAQLVACAAPEYLDRHGTPAVPAELKAHNCLIYTGSSWQHMWPFRRNGGIEKVSVTGNIRSNDNGLLRGAALKGLGIVIQPSFNIWQDLQTGLLMPLLADWAIEELGVFVTFPERRYLPGKVRAFIDFLAEHFAASSGWATETNQRKADADNGALARPAACARLLE